MSKQLAYAVVAGLAAGALAWIDPIFVPLVLAGPIVTGAIAATRRIRLTSLVVAWAVAGCSMIVSDWIVNHEDVAFHAGLTLFMSVLAVAAWAVTTRFSGGRHARAAP